MESVESMARDHYLRPVPRDGCDGCDGCDGVFLRSALLACGVWFFLVFPFAFAVSRLTLEQ